MTLVDATFKPRRRTVAISNKLGKLENSSGRYVCNATISTSNETKMLVIKNETIKIPKRFNYKDIKSISNEGREKLNSIRPETLGQAMRISGITPADISILSVMLIK